ncbi:hypothetical protein VPH35_056666 [Triticum aestivum]
MLRQEEKNLTPSPGLISNPFLVCSLLAGGSFLDCDLQIISMLRQPGRVGGPTLTGVEAEGSRGCVHRLGFHRHRPWRLTHQCSHHQSQLTTN